MKFNLQQHPHDTIPLLHLKEKNPLHGLTRVQRVKLLLQKLNKKLDQVLWIKNGYVYFSVEERHPS